MVKKMLNIVTSLSIMCLATIVLIEKARADSHWAATEHELNMLWAEVNEMLYGDEECLRSEELTID